MTASDQSRPVPTDRVIHLEDARMRVRERRELLVEGVTAFTLLSAVQTEYLRHNVDAFVVLNAVAGVALALVVIRGVIEMRRHKDAGSTGVNVVGVFGALAAIIEGLHKLHAAQFTFGHNHFALGVFTIFTGLLTGTVALLMERLEHRRALTITGDGIRMRFNKFRRFSASWADIAELQLDAKQARLVSAGGKAYVVPLARLVNRDEVREALIEAARERRVTISEMETKPKS
jgi:hypothetical protein